MRWDAAAQQIVFGTVDPAAASSLTAQGPPAGVERRLEPVPRAAAELRRLQQRAVGIPSLWSTAPRSWDGTVQLSVSELSPSTVEAISALYADDLDAICLEVTAAPQSYSGP